MVCQAINVNSNRKYTGRKNLVHIKMNKSIEADSTMCGNIEQNNEE
jgi:hypothetical protein